MRLQINGEIKILELNQAYLINVINRIGHDSRTVIVEFNGVIVRPDEWEQQQVKDGDIIEIVTIVGGGS